MFEDRRDCWIVIEDGLTETVFDLQRLLLSSLKFEIIAVMD